LFVFEWVFAIGAMGECGLWNGGFVPSYFEPAVHGRILDTFEWSMVK
jgi:hypothetical protein